MGIYDTYLKEQGYAKSTIASYLRSQELFSLWCNSRGYEAETIGYKECLEYVKHLQAPRGRKLLDKKSVKHKVGSLKIYFNYLMDENRRGDNPFKNINIRGIKRSLNHNLLEFEELEDLYYSLPTLNIELPNLPVVAYRNKVMTGFIVYQGMNATALKSLTVDHLNIEKGAIRIPETKKTAGRTLELKSQQIIPLISYVENHLETMQEITCDYSSALFPIRGDRFYWIERLFGEFKRINHKAKDLKQLRVSVITYWLKHHNIREVQYMAGHRYISSTERYIQDDLENLHEIVQTLHPIS